MNADLAVRASRFAVFPVEDYQGYVDQHPDATPYHRSGWLTAAEAGYGHTAWVVSAHRGEKLCGVLPLVEVKPPLGSSSLVSLPFCDLGGPLADNEDIRYSLTEAARKLASTNRSNGVEIRVSGEPVDMSMPAEALPAKVRMLLDLPESSEALFKQFKPKLRSQIRKAEKNGLTAEIHQDPAAIDAFYEVFADNMHRLGSPVHSLAWFRTLAQAYGDHLLIGLVYAGAHVVGAGIVLTNGTRASIPWASTRAEYNHLAPNMLLYWTFLSHLADAGYRQFDFGRSTPGEGTFRFKKQWGALPTELNWQRLEPAGSSAPESRTPSGTVSATSRIRRIVETLWQRMPLGLANWLGPKLRKYITL